VLSAFSAANECKGEAAETPPASGNRVKFFINCRRFIVLYYRAVIGVVVVAENAMEARPG
jgi:hypothetical protein